MLFIGDIHINTRYQEKIITQIRDYVVQYPDEQHIIFVGDYVYHFSYQREAILSLFRLFIELVQQWKSLYILAGNHDWLGQSFVYDEAHQLINSIWLLTDHSHWSLQFITKPEQLTIEWQDILFLPYLLDGRYFHTQQAWPSQLDLNNPKHGRQELVQSPHNNEQFSWQLNQYIDHTLTQRSLQPERSSQLMIIHHYYTANTLFPWQKNRFRFKDIALDPVWLDDERLCLVSWHIHQPFSYKNYLCVGSIRHTSPLEINEMKYLFQYDSNKQFVVATSSLINPYLLIDHTHTTGNDKSALESGTSSPLNEEDIRTAWHTIHHISQQYLTHPDSTRQIIHATEDTSSKLALSSLSLSLKVSSINYDSINDHIDESVRKSLQDMKLKKHQLAANDLLEQLTEDSQNLTSWRHDRKAILKAFLHKKYGEEYDTYEQTLQDLGLL